MFVSATIRAWWETRGGLKLASGVAGWLFVVCGGLIAGKPGSHSDLC
jgi:hypothetical protein